MNAETPISIPLTVATESLGTIASQSVGAIASETFQSAAAPISTIGEAGTNFAFNPSVGLDIKPSVIMDSMPSISQTQSLEEILSLPYHEINPDFMNPGRTALEPFISLDRFNAEIQPVIENLKPQESVNSRDYEISSDGDLLTEAFISISSEPELSSEEKAFWKQKFEKLFLEKYLIDTQPLETPTLEIEEEMSLSHLGTINKTEVISAVQVEPVPETQPEALVQTLTSSNQVPPEVPTEVGSEISEPEEQEPVTEKDNENTWDIYSVTAIKKVAEKSLNKRFKVASNIVWESKATNTASLASAVENNVYKLDIPDITEAINIARGKLELPPAALNAQYHLSLVENKNNPKAIKAALYAAISSSTPKEKVNNVKFEKRLEESLLPEEPQTLAKKGAKYIALTKRLIWKSQNKPKRVEPIEMDLVKKAA